MSRKSGTGAFGAPRLSGNHPLGQEITMRSLTRHSGLLWPRYLEKPHDDLVALGVIGLNYGRLETNLRRLFAAATEMKPRHLSALFYRIQNDIRMKALTELLRDADLTPELREHVSYFLSCYETCAGNRNDLMHSLVGGKYSDIGRNEAGVILTKYSRAGNLLYCTARLSDLRRVADEMFDLANFAYGTATWIRMMRAYRSKGKEDEFRQLILPQKPAEPTSLDWHSADTPPNKSCQPRSSLA
jgi:hypothetical protein